MKLFAQESGTEGAPTILFLHGAGQDHRMWQEQVRDLQDYHCLAVDLPGHGRSNQIGWVSLEETAVLLARIVAEKATGGKAHVVGLSLGGYLTLLLALVPQRTARIVVSGISVRPIPGKAILKLFTAPISLFLKSDYLIRSSARQLNVPEEGYQVFRDAIKQMDRKAYVRVSNQAVDFKLPPAAAQMASPALLVAGDQEILVVRESLRDLANVLPNARSYLAPGVGHGWVGEKPALFTAMIRAWLEESELPAELTAVVPTR